MSVEAPISNTGVMTIQFVAIGIELFVTIFVACIACPRKSDTQDFEQDIHMPASKLKEQQQLSRIKKARFTNLCGSLAYLISCILIFNLNHFWYFNFISKLICFIFFLHLLLYSKKIMSKKKTYFTVVSFFNYGV